MCPIVPTFTCGLLRSNFSFAIQFLSQRTPAAALQEPLAPAGLCAIRVLLHRNQFPGLVGTGPPASLRVVLVQAPINVRRDSDVVLPRRHASKHVQKTLQILEPLTRIELVTSSLPR